MSDNNTMPYPKCTYCGNFHRYSADMCKDMNQKYWGTLDRSVDTIADLRRQLAAASIREARLAEYAEHRADCNADLSEGDDVYHCTCGLDALLRELGETRG